MSSESVYGCCLWRATGFLGGRKVRIRGRRRERETRQGLKKGKIRAKKELGRRQGRGSE
jgi:hypothetical protein